MLHTILLLDFIKSNHHSIKTWVEPGARMPLTTFLIFLICLEQHNSIMDKNLIYGVSILLGTSFPLSPKTINNWLIWSDQICEEFCAFFFFFCEYTHWANFPWDPKKWLWWWQWLSLFFIFLFLLLFILTRNISSHTTCS